MLHFSTLIREYFLLLLPFYVLTYSYSFSWVREEQPRWQKEKISHVIGPLKTDKCTRTAINTKTLANGNWNLIVGLKVWTSEGHGRLPGAFAFYTSVYNCKDREPGLVVYFYPEFDTLQLVDLAKLGPLYKWNSWRELDLEPGADDYKKYVEGFNLQPGDILYDPVDGAGTFLEKVPPTTASVRKWHLLARDYGFNADFENMLDDAWMGKKLNPDDPDYDPEPEPKYLRSAEVRIYREEEESDWSGLEDFVFGDEDDGPKIEEIQYTKEDPDADSPDLSVKQENASKDSREAIKLEEDEGDFATRLLQNEHQRPEFNWGYGPTIPMNQLPRGQREFQTLSNPTQETVESAEVTTPNEATSQAPEEISAGNFDDTMPKVPLEKDELPVVNPDTGIKERGVPTLGTKTEDLIREGAEPE
ncbi:hypothetical protein ABW19_dt0203615 [Dactylella cylindrospora]|nr:hypothetical protein ABW19_dt0203615 [Dactylella cylindrospora]